MMILRKHSRHIQIGRSITGRWHRNEYKILRKLGAGAIGSVYLVEVSKGRLAALKLSDHPTAMTTEVNVLKALNKVQGEKLGPYLLDVDDWVVSTGETYSFYVMEFINGLPLEQYVRRKGTKYIGILFVHMLHGLEKIHNSGWIFGDLKLENMMVTENPLKIRFIDVGGVTKKGRAIKEFTEFNDRGYWGLGTRKADEAYDLFALVMLCLNIFYPRRFKRKENNLPLIMDYIIRVPSLKPYAQVFRKALLARYASAQQMKADFIPLVKKESKKGDKKKQATDNRHQNLTFWLESVGLGTMGIVYYLIAELLM